LQCHIQSKVFVSSHSSLFFIKINSMKRTNENRSAFPITHLLVLVPHRDVRRLLRIWSASLFAFGVDGAWSFPWVAPLASLHRPLAAREIKPLAHQLRRHANLLDGRKFTSRELAATALPTNKISGEMPQVFGPGLNIDLPHDFFEPCKEAAINPIAPVVLGSVLAHAPLPLDIPASPEIAFRAAALANMHLRPIMQGSDWDGFSFEWSIGTLCWLPNEGGNKP
jgi:hypothetical protein